MNHSCSPNCVSSFSFTRGAPPLIRIRTVDTIPKNGEMCTSYIDVGQPRSRRGSELMSGYCFLCGCGLCSSDPGGEPGEDVFGRVERNKREVQGEGRETGERCISCVFYERRSVFLTLEENSVHRRRRLRRSCQNSTAGFRRLRTLPIPLLP